MLTIVLWKTCSLNFFKQLPSNFSLALSRVKLIVTITLLSDTARGLIVSGDNPLDFHGEICCVTVVNVKYFYNCWNTK